MTAPKPHIQLIIRPGTAYENQSFWYHDFNIQIINNGSGEAQYLSFYVITPENVTNHVLNSGIFMRHNISINYAASSCDAENINGSLAVVAISNFGPKQRCDIDISIYLTGSGIGPYVLNGHYFKNYTDLENYFNEDWRNLFLIENITSDSNITRSADQCPPERLWAVAQGYIVNSSGSITKVSPNVVGYTLGGAPIILSSLSNKQVIPIQLYCYQ